MRFVRVLFSIAHLFRVYLLAPSLHCAFSSNSFQMFTIPRFGRSSMLPTLCCNVCWMISIESHLRKPHVPAFWPSASCLPLVLLFAIILKIQQLHFLFPIPSVFRWLIRVPPPPPPDCQPASQPRKSFSNFGWFNQFIQSTPRCPLNVRSSGL